MTILWREKYNRRSFDCAGLTPGCAQDDKFFGGREPKARAAAGSFDCAVLTHGFAQDDNFIGC
jgi:hypothetical protein